MALPASGAISIRDINTELGYDYNYELSFSTPAVKTLAGVASGDISINNFWGKSNRVARTITIASNRDTYNLTPSGVSGYVAGKTDVTLEIASGVYLYSVLTSQAALIVEAFAAGDTVKIVNNGYIMGKGGDASTNVALPNGGDGGPAINLSYPVSITNNSYIAGGGGAGGMGRYSTSGYFYLGGGGAGGGSSDTNTGGGPGAAGIPATTASGTSAPINTFNAASRGGGGGRILPGTGGAGGSVLVAFSAQGASFRSGVGGGAGGGGAAAVGGLFNTPKSGNGGAGGSGNAAGGHGIGIGDSAGFGGGGGGWGAAGGNGTSQGATYATGGAGGKAIALNGYTATILTTGTVYGLVS